MKEEEVLSRFIRKLHYEIFIVLEKQTAYPSEEIGDIFVKLCQQSKFHVLENYVKNDTQIQQRKR